MGYIAKGTITLDTVNDAYTVSLTKSSCVIHADFDGSNPQLDDAWTQITVCRGDKRMAFDCTKIEETNRPEVKITTDNRMSYIVRLTSVPFNSLEGSVGLHIHTDDGWNTDIRLAYTIVRESTMLDWIKDWEGGKTKIGGTYIMTPKLFIGKKENFAEYAEGGSSPQSDIMAVPGLTGVYIGPDASSTGLYGYSNSKEIFRLNDKGGMIGGWAITETGLTSRNGLLQILGDGAIKASNDKGDTMWEINQDGAASFAKGNVNFYANGNADFKGKITSTEGSIGGWSITQNQIWKGNLGLDCRENAIGVAKANIVFNAITNEPCLLSSVKNAGGVAIFYGSETNWGLIGYKPSSLGRPTCVFELGAANSIAGWSFDQSALWSGIKNDTVGAYTTDGITLGANGIRGKKWYIDTNGNVSFMGGLISFSTDNNGGEIVGWKLNAKRLSNPNVAIVSDTANAGIFMSVADGTDFNNFASSSLTDYIDVHGGIYMKTKTDGVSFAAYDQNGYKIFKLRSNGVSSIANWNIENDALFIGSKKVEAGSFTDAAGSITLSETGIRSNKWRLEADGSGSLAGDKINWDKAGNIVVDAKISANNITAGIISTASIRNQSDTWYLNQDGSGALAGNKLTWNKDGVLRVQNSRLTNVIIDGAIKTPFQDGQYVLGDDGPVTFSTTGLQNNNNVVIPGVGNGWNLDVTIPFDVKYNGFRAIIMNDDWGSEVAGGAWSVEAPSGKYFYENGIAKKILQLMPYTGVEMIGYGDTNTFKGWIILNRIEKVGNKGFPLHVCFCGIVKDGQLTKIKKYNDENITVSKQSKGIYRVTFGQPWSSVDNYMVFLTGQAENSGRYASIYQKTTTYFDVYCGDDETPNDGDFQFMVVNVSPAYLT